MARFLFSVEVKRTDGVELPAELVPHEDPNYNVEEWEFLQHVRNNSGGYGYVVDRTNGMVYFRGTSVPLEQFAGLKATLVSKEV